MEGVYYYLGQNGKEYFTAQDAEKIGGGLKGRRFHNPKKVYETVKYEDIVPSTTTTTVPVITPSVQVIQTPAEAVAANSLASTEYDNLTKEQLREALRQKGIPIRGNPSENTMRTALKATSPLQQ